MSVHMHRARWRHNICAFYCAHPGWYASQHTLHAQYQQHDPGSVFFNSVCHGKITFHNGTVDSSTERFPAAINAQCSAAAHDDASTSDAAAYDDATTSNAATHDYSSAGDAATHDDAPARDSATYNGAATGDAATHNGATTGDAATHDGATTNHAWNVDNAASNDDSSTRDTARLGCPGFEYADEFDLYAVHVDSGIGNTHPVAPGMQSKRSSSRRQSKQAK